MNAVVELDSRCLLRLYVCGHLRTLRTPTPRSGSRHLLTPALLLASPLTEMFMSLMPDVPGRPKKTLTIVPRLVPQKVLRNRRRAFSGQSVC